MNHIKMWYKTFLHQKCMVTFFTLVKWTLHFYTFRSCTRLGQWRLTSHAAHRAPMPLSTSSLSMWLAAASGLRSAWSSTTLNKSPFLTWLLHSVDVHKITYNQNMLFGTVCMLNSSTNFLCSVDADKNTYISKCLFHSADDWWLKT